MSNTRNINPEVLIELVKNNECLYNVRNEYYKVRPVKDKVWSRIAETLGRNRKFLLYFNCSALI